MTEEHKQSEHAGLPKQPKPAHQTTVEDLVERDVNMALAAMPHYHAPDGTPGRVIIPGVGPGDDDAALAQLIAGLRRMAYAHYRITEPTHEQLYD